MRHIPFSVLVLASVLGLSACSKPPPPGIGTRLSESVAYFTVEPGQVYDCEGRDRVTATVKWKVTDPAVTSVLHQVNSASQPKRSTFATEGASGQARTEEWVVAGTRFYLVDANSGKDLATYEEILLPCE